MNKLNILILYASHSTHTSTVMEHLNAFKRYSSFNVFYADSVKSADCSFDLEFFDVVVVHYSVRLTYEDYFARDFAVKVEAYSGMKVVFVQDEYEHTEMTRKWIEKLKFDVVFTCVPQKYIENIYPKFRFPKTEFIVNLTGYVPESLEHMACRAIRERTVDIGYRGRALHPIYGRLGVEKEEIGKRIKAIASPDLAVDIEWDDHHRIYGAGWYSFIGECRAMLGTESGANIFDFDGTLKISIDKYLVQNPSSSYSELASDLRLNEVEGKYALMNQISPKVFEAVSLKTVLILLEGEYSGVLEKDVHYFSLKRDYSNAEEIFEKLKNHELVQSMVDRAYQDVILSKEYSYERFIRRFDEVISRRVTQSCGWVVLDPSTIYINEKTGEMRTYSRKYGFPTIFPIPSNHVDKYILKLREDDKVSEQLYFLWKYLRFQNKQMAKVHPIKLLKIVYSFFPEALKEIFRPALRRFRVVKKN